MFPGQHEVHRAGELVRSGGVERRAATLPAVFVYPASRADESVIGALLQVLGGVWALAPQDDAPA